MSGLAQLDQNPTRKLPTHRFVRERRHSDTGSFSDPACGSRRRPDPVGARIVPTQRIAIQWVPNDILKSATLRTRRVAMIAGGRLALLPLPDLRGRTRVYPSSVT